MTSEHDPRVVAADRMLADPAAVRDGLAADVAAVRALGRSGARVDPAAGAAAVLDGVHANAARLGFASEVDAATRSLRHITDLPAAERGGGSPIGPFHEAAGRTVAAGTVVSQSVRAGEHRLVFHRKAPVAEGVTVRLEACVRVAADGGVWLESFGRPVAEAAVPVYDVARTGRELLAEALDRLRGPAPFDEAMLMVCLAGLASPDPAADEPDRHRVADAVVARAADLAGYVARTESSALGVRADGRFGACLYRSALEFLFERHLGGIAVSVVDMEDVDDIDEELRDALPDTPRLAPEAVPQGVPAHHWWWTLPD
ncbi:hypothetical protein HUT06_14550 [Actinomadura sp. NAK00032]|uniref:hypothetical protein n=1 Tax=Actinomadura sp. NAK00032 TaxID=2742128 RepID=UPI001590AE5B|nr:hypothetical protein [Actinomadura sp. NAK00032]QKW35101.1 hypothetical protein HUT06_14550 [Actinomadura sp. NAK00032]